MKSNSFFRTFSQILFIVVAFILSVLVANGFSVDFSNALSWQFGISVLSKLVITLLTYNIVFNMDSTNRRKAGKTAYFITLMTNKEKIKVLYEQKRIEDLDIALKKYNEEKRIEEYNKKLRSICSRLYYSDIDFESENIEKDIKKKFKISDKTIKKLMKVIKSIQEGNFPYEELEVDDILIDQDEKGDKQLSMKFNANAFIIKQNIVKAATFLVTTILLTVVTLNSSQTSIWGELLKNATLLLGGMVSAMTLSANYIKKRQKVFELRNIFLQTKLDIKVVYEHIEP